MKTSLDKSDNLVIPVVSGEITPEFLNAPWQKIRDALYAYPFVTINQPDATQDS